MERMRKLILLILLAAVFLGGYFLGHAPDSPDIFAWAQDAYEKVVAQDSSDADSLCAEAALQSVCAEPICIRIGERVYRIGSQ